MNKVIRQRRTRLGSGLTTVDASLSTSIDDQRDVVAQWATILPRITVSGPQEPRPANGVRYIKTKELPSISNLLRSYMQSFPGADICALAQPDILINPEGVTKLLEHVDSLRMEMAWACHLNLEGSIPRAFILTSSVIAHLVNDIPVQMTFADDWRSWVHDWMGRLLRQRYFDGTQFGLIRDIPVRETAMISIAELGQLILQNQKPEPKKKSVVRKVKIKQ